MSPLISVCIPTYNSARYLGDAIRSVLEQDVGDYELIIVDNASTDETDSVVASFTDARIRYSKNAINLGAPANGNLGMDYARGRFIKYLCSDDVLLPGILRKQVEMMQSHPAVGLVTSNMYVTDEHLEHKRLASFYPGVHPGAFIVHQSLNAIQNYIGGPSNIMVRRESLGTLRGDVRYHWVGDLAFFCSILSRADYANIDEPGVLYRRHAGAASVVETSERAKALEEFNLINELHAFTHANAFKLLQLPIGMKNKARAALWLAVNAWRIRSLLQSISDYEDGRENVSL